MLVVRADCTYSHTGEGLHHFVDPADDRVYLYSQFEVPDARRVFTTLRAARPQVGLHLQRDRAGALEGRLQRADARAVPASDGIAVWSFPTTKRMSTYITAVVAGEYYEVHDVYEGKYGTIPLGHYSRQSLAEHRDRDEIVLLTKQGFEFFEEAFGYPYPFEKYDQLYVPEYNMGAMENAGCVTLRDEYLPRSRQPRSFYEFRASVILHEMAHMWFGDLVTMRWWDDLWLNESFAEWACYHAEAEATAYTDAWTGFANARKQRGCADQLPSTHPIATDIFDLARGRGELRHDHLRQGRGGAQAAGRVGRPRAFLAGLRQYFRDHEYANTEFGDLLAALEKSSGPRARGLGRRSGCRPPASTRSPPTSSWPTTAPTPRSPSARPPPTDYPTLRRHRIGIGLYDERRAAALVRRTSIEVDVAGELTEIAELVGKPQPDLLLLNDGDLTYAKIRLDERSLATASRPVAARRLADARAVLERGLGHDPRRRDDRDRLRRAGARQHRLRDRRVGRHGVPGVRRAGGHPVRRPRQPRRARARVGAGAAQAARDRRARHRPPADVRPLLRRRRPQRPGDRRPRGAARRLAGLRRASPSTRTCGGRCSTSWPATGRADEAPDRRRAGARQHHLRPGARRGRPRRAADRRGQGGAWQQAMVDATVPTRPTAAS